MHYTQSWEKFAYPAKLYKSVNFWEIPKLKTKIEIYKISKLLKISKELIISENLKIKKNYFIENVKISVTSRRSQNLI